jgi:hypothetical protein
MNIDKHDAQDALMIANEGYLNLKGVASTMARMLNNAVQLNEKFLRDDDAVNWVAKELVAIIDEKVIGNENPYPYTLRPQVFMATRKLYEMAFTIEQRNAPMSYAPLTVAAKCIALFTAHDSYYNRPGDNERRLVPHVIVSDGLGLRESDYVEVIVNDEIHSVNWYREAIKECSKALAGE